MTIFNFKNLKYNDYIGENRVKEIEENQKLIEYYNKIKEQGKTIQNKYNFKIPDYVLEAIVGSENKIEINSFINLAKVNNRITLAQAKILKKEYGVLIVY